MRAVRTAASAVSILVGAALLVAWLFSFLVVRSVEDGKAAHAVAKAALHSPEVVDRIVIAVDSALASSLRDAGVDVSATGLSGSVHALVERLAVDPSFEQMVLDQVDAASEDLHAQLTDPDRASAPYVIVIDVSDRVNDELDTLPQVGASLPTVPLPPVNVEVLSAHSFDQARDVYGRLDTAKRVFLWLGLAFVALGLAVSTRRRYVVGKFLLAVGAMSLLVGLLLAVADPDSLATRLPGGSDGTLGTVVSEALGGDQVARLRTVMLVCGAIALVAGAAATLIGKVSGGRR